LIILILLKVNRLKEIRVVAALNPSTKRMGIGVVARDASGRVVAAKAKVFHFIDDPTTA
jgi:hypothetical protein